MATAVARRKDGSSSSGGGGSGGGLAKGKGGGAGALKLPTREKSLLTSVLFVLPLMLAYQIGILASGFRNGVDYVTRLLFWVVGYQRNLYLLVNLGILVLFVAAVLYLRKKQKLDLKRFPMMLVESTVYALLMGSFILFLMSKVLHLSPRLAIAGSGAYDELVMSIGAGVHEELVFRMGLMVGLAWLGARVFKLKSGAALAGAFLVSSVLFSAAHHIGPFGEPFKFGVFTYRLLSGLVFATIFYYRSFATAVYTHALYDIYVLLVRG
ncbi:MAG: CPBP family intramembrane metalloprotease [Deltaproteobacteria bacterium]|nr:CPBP family intramembrane metalloprotease [Deltaproteobacteria bacterium]